MNEKQQIINITNMNEKEIKKAAAAHRQNDKAVMQTYGFSLKMTESECVAELFRLYTKIAIREQG